MSILLNEYMKQDSFESIIDDFYNAVCSSDLVKHYFILAKKNTVVYDMKKYWPYLTLKTKIDYRRPATPSASSDIQLPESQFAEILVIINKIFRQYKIDPEHTSQLSHEILEIIEESRSQTNDTLPSILKPVEVNPEKIQFALKRNKIISEVMPSKAIATEKGLPYKTWIYLDQDTKRLTIECKAFVSDAAGQTEIDELLEKHNEKNNFVKVQLKADGYQRYLSESHDLPYKDGIPVRLFSRYLRRFSQDFDHIFKYDTEKVLKGH